MNKKEEKAIRIAQIEGEKAKVELARLGFIAKGTKLIEKLAYVGRFDYEERYKVLNEIKELKQLLDNCDDTEFYITIYEEKIGEKYRGGKK